jgi:hypothetical protein
MDWIAAIDREHSALQKLLSEQEPLQAEMQLFASGITLPPEQARMLLRARNNTERSKILAAISASHR